MDALTRVERVLATSVAAAEGPGAPPHLAAAIRHAVFPGGARVRPRLCLAVAAACGDPTAAEAAAAAIELLHCASLVHDDLPCFDDAPIRRGRPSVHAAFGECLALLAGDALIVMAFEALACGTQPPARLAQLLRVLATAAGTPRGLVAGQAWESERRPDLAAYQRAKTASLFSAAAMMGALASGAAAEPWRAVGERLGEAYQVADDIRDVAGDPATLGKPAGRDQVLGRPNAALQLGLSGALRRLRALVADAVAAIPPCPHAHGLRLLMLAEVETLLPANLALQAA